MCVFQYVCVMCCTQLFPCLTNNYPVCLSQQQCFLKSAALSHGNTLAQTQTHKHTHSLKSKCLLLCESVFEWYVCVHVFRSLAFRFADLCQLRLCQVGNPSPGLLHLRQSYCSHRRHHHRPGEDRTRCSNTSATHTHFFFFSFFFFFFFFRLLPCLCHINTLHVLLH